jgi:predicted PurR-regulated permease PerM
LTIIVWITVALYPIFDWFSAKLCGHRALPAIVITVVTFFVMLGPPWSALH